ncbi:MAG: hypothetical protein ACYC4L_01535 [Chloroflexota bacterium]
MGKRAVLRQPSAVARPHRAWRRWLLLLLVIPLLAGLAFAVASVLVPSGQNGNVVAQALKADLGRIPYGGGLVTTKFALDVSGEVRAASLSTT